LLKKWSLLMLVLDVLVIGAGMSGLIAARELQKFDLKVACVEKARGSGGRLS
jgi:renalase